jgi:hypothetical protein
VNDAKCSSVRSVYPRCEIRSASATNDVGEAATMALNPARTTASFEANVDIVRNFFDEVREIVLDTPVETVYLAHDGVVSIELGVDKQRTEYFFVLI